MKIRSAAAALFTTNGGDGRTPQVSNTQLAQTRFQLLETARAVAATDGSVSVAAMQARVPSLGEFNLRDLIGGTRTPLATFEANVDQAYQGLVATDGEGLKWKSKPFTTALHESHVWRPRNGRIDDQEAELATRRNGKGANGLWLQAIKDHTDQ